MNHLNQRDSVFHAEGSNQFLVHGLVAVLGEDAEQGLPLVQGLGGLPQSAGKTISNQSLEIEDVSTKGIEDFVWKG